MKTMSKVFKLKTSKNGLAPSNSEENPPGNLSTEICWPLEVQTQMPPLLVYMQRYHFQ